MGDILVIVGRPGGKPILVIDKETGRLLLFTTTMSKNIQPGEYNDETKIVDMMIELATRGHKVKSLVTDEEKLVMYNIIESMLKTNIPYPKKLEQIKKYVRAVIRK